MTRPPIIEAIRAEARGHPDEIYRANLSYPDPAVTRNIFTLYDGNRWMEVGERQPHPKMLFGEFWHEGELCILFADTNTGKSVLAVQIAESIARSRKIDPFAAEAERQVVLYVDFELSGKQFHLRYHGAGGSYAFSENFYRAQFNPENEMPGDAALYDQYLMAAITDRITQLKATVLIVDNITCMRNGTENSRVALRLMKDLKQLKSTYGLSVLVLAHTPKRNPANPLTPDDLHGSKLLINFADSAFALGKSAMQPGLTYLKQIKQRNTAEIFGAQNVCLGSIIKPANFVHFQFSGTGHEADHLYRPPRLQRQQLTQQIAALSRQGYSQRRISRQLRIPLSTVNRLMQDINILLGSAADGSEVEACLP
ncbi:MAG: AAA family ATPase [Sphingobacteriales bacterium]